MKPIALLALLLAAFPLLGQRARLEKADKLFHQYAFSQAAGLYEKALARQDNTQARINLAECYRLTQDFEKAEYWYSQAVGRPGVNPVFKLYYGQMLQSNGKCQEARYWFREYDRLKPQDSRGKRFEAACDEMVGYYDDEGRYTLEPLSINTPFSDFGPAFFENGLVFVSARQDGRGGDRTAAWSGEPYLDLFFSRETDQGFQEPERFGGSALNSKHHEGPLTFSADGQQVYFTRNNAVSESVKEDDKTRTVRLKIYAAERSGRSNWGKVRELTFNSGDYSNSAPALHPNGELMIFSSTMPGGFGGADLYLSRLTEGEWSRPVNLGAAINTEGDEMFPFLHTDGTLYFSSDGHAGLGGLDVFYAEWKDERWDNVRNMGWTLNSRWDDFGLVWDEDRRRGFFASNRPGGAGGDDLYAMRHNWVRVRGQVLDAATGLPLPGSSLHILGGPGEKRLQADAEGLFSIDLPPRVAASLSAHSEGYTEGRAELTTPADGESELVRIALERDPVKVNLLAVDRQTRKPVPGVEFVWENGCSGSSSRHPGNEEGRLSMPVSRYCTYRLTATVEGYADGELAVPASLLEGQSEVDLVVDLEFLHPGMVVELHNIYYDFDQDYVREDGEADLIALAEFMQRNPGVSIELESHTDARGTNTYNTQLSQRRAESARSYLVKLGVEPGRVTARGYGESALRNQCSDGVNCSDEEHQMNRRTQFRITGLDRELQSSDKPFVPVNTGRRAR